MKNGQFVVLALYELHMASAAVLVDGQVAAAAHEERFSRIKNDVGFPYQAAAFCLKSAGIEPEEVDVVAYANQSIAANTIAKLLFKRYALFSIDDYVLENEVYWKPLLLEGRDPGFYFDVMGGAERVAKGHYYDLSKLEMSAAPEQIVADFHELRLEVVERCLNIPRNRVRFYPNHMCHLYHAYYSGHLRGPDVLVVDVEGEGEPFNLVAAVVTPTDMNVVAATDQCMLGRMYQWMTLLLGMKPYHHEYKLMGLAPWANDHEIQKSYKVFEPIFQLSEEDMVIRSAQRPADLFYTFRDRLKGHRFDGIAGAVQRMLEVRLSEWLNLAVERTGCSRICYAGGVAMNVKANMRLAALDSVRDFFVPISPGDESSIFGAAYWATVEYFRETGRDPESIPPMTHGYFGPEYDRASAVAAIAERNITQTFHIYENVSADQVAALLADGLIVARYQGRSEFGQRALGNRSILANPSVRGTVDKINHQIKYRDFWMPFAVTILEEHQHEYIENPRNIKAPFMTMAFPVKQERKDEIIAGIHAADLSARPQILTALANADYHELISAFRRRTGIGALLNTSFNLHGEPIVNTPDDALHTFVNSELDVLWIHDILITRAPVVLDGGRNGRFGGDA